MSGRENMIPLKFVNQEFCRKNGFKMDSDTIFSLENKKHYQRREDYDWVLVADKLIGLEAILHRLREMETRSLIKKYAKGNKFLDAGCGTGLVLRHLPSSSVGFDINPRNLAKAKIHAPKANLIKGDIEKMPFGNARFTTIICTDVLEHLVETRRALDELFRVLSPGGVLIGSVPAANPVWGLRFLSSTHPGEPYHRIYQANELKRLFNNRGKLLKLKRACFLMNFFFVVTR